MFRGGEGNSTSVESLRRLIVEPRPRDKETLTPFVYSSRTQTNRYFADVDIGKSTSTLESAYGSGSRPLYHRLKSTVGVSDTETGTSGTRKVKLILSACTPDPSETISPSWYLLLSNVPSAPRSMLWSPRSMSPPRYYLIDSPSPDH